MATWCASSGAARTTSSARWRVGLFRACLRVPACACVPVTCTFCRHCLCRQRCGREQTRNDASTHDDATSSNITPFPALHLTAPHHTTRRFRRSAGQVGKFRHYVGDLLGLRSKGFHALWVVNFPLVEFNDEQGRFTVRAVFCVA
jgi:hypothetical protein